VRDLASVGGPGFGVGSEPFIGSDLCLLINVSGMGYLKISLDGKSSYI
jgi:hypothetical protein